jgi:SAM-dependent methyltransferase
MDPTRKNTQAAASIPAKAAPVFTNAGFCHSCNQKTRFSAYGNYWRLDYQCDNCGSIPRERALMFVIEKFFPEWKSMTIHETSPSPRGTSLRLSKESHHYIASQYYPHAPFGWEHDGFRNEDLEALTFEDQSLDLHVSQDVMEHILDPRRAFQEIARTLKPGGAHVFTTPLVNKNKPTEWRVRRKSDGTIEHLVSPPEYHDNPISPEGSLVAVHWGYDIADFIFRSSGLFTEMVYIDALDLGIRADLIEVLITRKPMETIS